MPSSPTRRAVLAACGAGTLAGCTSVLGGDSSSPDIECGPPGDKYAWPTAGYAADRTSRLSETDLPDADAEAVRLSQTNSVSGGLSSFSTPAVGDGTAYVAGDTKVAAYDLETGDERWGFDPDRGAEVPPALGCETLYVSTVEETLALSPEDGAVRWRTDAGTTRGGSPAVVGDTVYVNSGGVTALDAETGERRWNANPRGAGRGFAVADMIYKCGQESVAALTRAGDDWWRATGVGEVYAAPAVADGIVYAATKNGKLVALDAADGSIRWREPIEVGVYATPAVGAGRVVVEAGNGDEAIAFDAETGEEQWRFETGLSTVAPTIVGDAVLVPGANTGFHLLDLETGERRRHWPIPHVGSQPVVAEGRILYRAFTVSDVFVLG